MFSDQKMADTDITLIILSLLENDSQALVSEHGDLGGRRPEERTIRRCCPTSPTSSNDSLVLGSEHEDQETSKEEKKHQSKRTFPCSCSCSNCISSNMCEMSGGHFGNLVSSLQDSSCGNPDLFQWNIKDNHQDLRLRIQRAQS